MISPAVSVADSALISVAEVFEAGDSLASVEHTEARQKSVLMMRVMDLM
jgi:hypothetical protein